MRNARGVVAAPAANVHQAVHSMLLEVHRGLVVLVVEARSPSTTVVCAKLASNGDYAVGRVLLAVGGVLASADIIGCSRSAEGM